MNEKEDTKRLVREYLTQVEEQFPGWLEKKEEKEEEILSEIEDRIYETAKNISEQGKVTETSVKNAIRQLGPPKSVVREYTQRGTPKVFITEEWWPYYKKWMLASAIVVIILHITSFLYNLFKGRIMEAFSFLNIFSSLLVVCFVITFVFVMLSMEGYLPEDFNLQPELVPEQEYEEDILQIPELKPLTSIIKPKEELVSGFFACVFSSFLLLMPYLQIGESIHPDFIFILQLGGLLFLAGGVNSVVRGSIGTEAVTGQQIGFFVESLLKIASIPVLMLILQRPEIFPIIYYSSERNQLMSRQIPTEYYHIFQNIIIVFIAIQAILVIYTVYKAGTLEKYKFFERMKK